MRLAFAIIGLTLALTFGLASFASAIAHADDCKQDTCARAVVIDDSFHLADRFHIRVFEDGSARVCYRVRVWPLDYRPTFGRFTRVCGGVGVPW